MKPCSFENALVVCCVLLLSIIGPQAVAQEMLTEHTMKVSTDAVAADAMLSEFAWLQGEWSGEGLGAKCDETWSSPAGGCMVGMFRMVKDEELVFSEFFILVRKDNKVVLRLKHFGKDFVGWEEKDKSVDFPLIKVEDKTAWFGGLTYQLQPDGSLKAWVAMKKMMAPFRRR